MGRRWEGAASSARGAPSTTPPDVTSGGARSLAVIARCWNDWLAALESERAVRVITSLPALYTETIVIFTEERPLQLLITLEEDMRR